MPASDERDSKSSASRPTASPPIAARLSAALRALDEDDRRHLSASVTVEARLLADVRARAWAQRRRRMHTAITSAAAALIVAAGLWVSFRPTNVASGDGTDARAAAEVTTGFMPLMYADVPMTDGHLVRLEVPRLALATFGLAPREVIDVDAARQTVLVDVLVGEDGLARAVRFVQASPRAGSSRR